MSSIFNNYREKQLEKCKIKGGHRLKVFLHLNTFMYSMCMCHQCVHFLFFFFSSFPFVSDVDLCMQHRYRRMYSLETRDTHLNNYKAKLGEFVIKRVPNLGNKFLLNDRFLSPKLAPSDSSQLIFVCSTVYTYFQNEIFHRH